MSVLLLAVPLSMISGVTEMVDPAPVDTPPSPLATFFDLFFIFLFAGDVSIRMFVMGWHAYVHDLLCLLDLFVSALDFITLLFASIIKGLHLTLLSHPLYLSLSLLICGLTLSLTHSLSLLLSLSLSLSLSFLLPSSKHSAPATWLNSHRSLPHSLTPHSISSLSP